MMHPTEKAPSKTAATAAEGKDQNTNTHEGELIMKNATSLPNTTDTHQDPPLTNEAAQGATNLVAQMKQYGVTTLGELHKAQQAELARPAWADTTHFDEIDGTLVGFSKVIADTDTLNATLFTDYSTALGNHDRLACDFKLDSALDFLTPDQVFEFAQDLTEAAAAWQQVRDGNSPGQLRRPAEVDERLRELDN